MNIIPAAGQTTFRDFIRDDKTTLDNLIIDLKDGRQDPYDILGNHIAYLQNHYNISPGTLKARVITAKNFFEYHDVDISVQENSNCK